MNFLNIKSSGVVCVAFLLLSTSYAGTPFFDESKSCPSASQCNGCDLGWDHPGVTEEDVLVGPDLCTVTISWEWPFDSNHTGPDPRMVFNCMYDNGESCNIGNEEICSSCESITFTGIHPSQNPHVSYSDTCGIVREYDIAKDCLPITEPPTTTEVPTTKVPTTEVPTTEVPTTEVPTTKVPTTEVPTTEVPTTEVPTTEVETTTSFESTTEGYFCPPAPRCQACPAEWEQPTLFREEVAVEEDSCDISFFWDSSLSSDEGGPRMGFSCIYSQTGEYCDERINAVCASCETTSFNGVRPSLKPVVHYTDSCGNSQEFSVADDCVYQPETTTSEITTSEPIDYCPDSSECSGCDPAWGNQVLHFTGTPMVNNICDITISWNFDVVPSEGTPNPRLTFQCQYDATGDFCPDAAITACATCEEVIFTDVNEALEPFINYSDTCGNLYRINIGNVCK